MSAREQFDEPRMVEVVDVQTNKQLVGKAFKAKAKEVQAALEAMGEEDALCLQVPSPCALTIFRLNQHDVAALRNQTKASLSGTHMLPRKEQTMRENALGSQHGPCRTCLYRQRHVAWTICTTLGVSLYFLMKFCRTHMRSAEERSAA